MKKQSRRFYLAMNNKTRLLGGIENMSIEERNRQFTLGYLGKVIHEKLRVIGIIGGFDLLQEVLKEIKKTS